MTRDYRDLVIEELADREAALRAQWRLERAALLDRIDAQHAELARLRDAHQRVVEEFRASRASTTCTPGGRAA